MHDLIQSNIMMDEDEGVSTLQARLRMKKAVTFAEQRSSILKQRIFSLLASLPRQKKQSATHYYHMVLCVKSFKGIMEFAIENRENQIRQAEEREKDSALQEQQMQGMVEVLQRTRKERHFRRFCMNVRQDIREKRQKERREDIAIAQSSKKTEQNDKYYKTEFPIRPREPQPAEISHQLDRTSPNFLESSRRSVLSQGLSTQDLFKRKFAAIKTLPPKPQPILTPAQQPKQMKQAELSIEQLQARPQISINNQQKPQMPQSSSRSIPQLPKQIKKQEPEAHIIKMKDKILGLLSEVKMAQITSLSDIVQQYSKTFKNQANIAEKHHIRESFKLLQRISLIK